MPPTSLNHNLNKFLDEVLLINTITNTISKLKLKEKDSMQSHDKNMIANYSFVCILFISLYTYASVFFVSIRWMAQS